MGNKMSMTSKFSKDVTLESGAVDKGMECVHLQLPSIVDVLTNNNAAFSDVVEHAQ